MLRYVGIPLAEYEEARQRLLSAGESSMHPEHIELMADQMRERFQRAFEAEDDGQKPEVVSELQGLVGKILRAFERQDLR